MSKTKAPTAQAPAETVATAAPVSVENSREDGVIAELTPEQADAIIRAENAAQPPAVQLVPMVRDAAQWPAPHAADVHPGEVENYRAGGWVRVN